MIVRDPVVVTASLPRFLDIGDRSRLQFDVDNVEGEAGEYRLALDIHGPLAAEADALSKTIKLGAHEKATVTMPIEANGVGTAALDLDVSGPGFSGAAEIRARRRSRARPTSTSARSADLGAGTDQSRSTTRRSHGFVAGHGVAVARASRRSAPSTRRRCCRRSTATPMAARSRR